MTQDVKQIVEEINKATLEMRSYVDRKLEETAKSGSADPVTQAAIDKANEQITELRKQMDEAVKAAQRPAIGGQGGQDDRDTEVRKSAFVKYLRYGIGESGRSVMTPEEVRAISSASDADGGFLVPIAWENIVLMQAYNEAEMRPACNVGTTGRDRVFMPSLKKPSVAWGIANIAVSPQDLTAGGETLPINDLRALVLIHNNTLDDAEADVWSELSSAFSRAIAEAEDEAFANGDGVNAPQGVLTNKQVLANFTKTGVAGALNDSSNNGVDALITMLHSLKKVYRRNSTWAMNSTTEGIVRQLKDNDGQYLWQPPVQAGTPATLLGRPVVNPEGLPDVAANAFPVVLGDFRSGYVIRDRAGVTVQRLVERYAEYDQTGFIVKRRTGGKVAMAEAFRCLKVST
jgi:HK97 family phage major capsid protein